MTSPHRCIVRVTSASRSAPDAQPSALGALQLRLVHTSAIAVAIGAYCELHHARHRLEQLAAREGEGRGGGRGEGRGGGKGSASRAVPSRSCTPHPPTLATNVCSSSPNPVHASAASVRSSAAGQEALPSGGFKPVRHQRGSVYSERGAPELV